MKRALLLPLFSGLLLSAPASAASFIIPTDARMIELADGIVIARVESMSARYIGDHIVTETTLRIRRVLKGGWTAGETVLVNVPGGVFGLNAQVISAAPAFWMENEALVFLERTPGTWRTWGLMLGKFDFVETMEGERLLVRGYRSFPVQGWTADGNPYLEPLRFADGFLSYIQDTVDGAPAQRDYFMEYRDRLVIRSSGAPGAEGDVAPLAHGVLASAYTSEPDARWNIFQSGGTATYYTTGTQPGLDGPGAVQRATAAWTNDPSSQILLAYGGGGGGTLAQDGKNSVVLNAPHLVPPPAVGYATWWMSSQHTWATETFWTISEGDVAIGVVPTQSILDEVVTHEIGHTIGLRHSDQGTPSSTQAVMKSTSTGSMGASLGPWDREAVAHVYGSGLYGSFLIGGSVIDVDANGTKDALTDGLLVLRYLFGFRGTTLTQGAIGSGAARSSAAAIEAYLASIQSQLDIDGNGRLEALTDGLLVLRYLFGFRGSTLVSGAVGSGATRNAAQIEAYLATL